MLADNLVEFSRTIGQDRLHAYRLASGDDLDMLANYVWNIALSEALYPTLEGLEIALRNSFQAAGTAQFGTDRWFDAQSVLALKQRERNMILDAKNNLTAHGKLLNAGRIIAELHFGFWISLLNRPYERVLWSHRPRDTNLIPAVFPNTPRTLRSRRPLHDRLDQVRRLRSRVFHYEPIWNWNLPNLRSQHAEVLEIMGWISPHTRQVIELVDHFPTVYQQERAPFRAKLARVIR